MQTMAMRIAAAAAMALMIAGLAACGGTGNPGAKGATASAAPSVSAAGVNPCSLLSDADVATLAPGLGHGTVDKVAGVAKVCDWPNSHGLPAIQLQVTPPPSSSLRDELRNGLAAGGGYTIMPVAGLGDEAAAAFQKADPSKGLTAGLATILARSGGEVIQLSTPELTIRKDSADFAKARALVAKAISRL